MLYGDHRPQNIGKVERAGLTFSKLEMESLDGQLP